MSSSKKYYVVWKGHQPGIYPTWADCRARVHGFTGAQYKSFPTLAEAQEAYRRSYWEFASQRPNPAPPLHGAPGPHRPIVPSLAVDAACSGVTGHMEYQGVDTATGQRLFHQGPFADGTNNIGEFLAIVHGLAHLGRAGSHIPLYTDSATALSWIRHKRANTTKAITPSNRELFALVARAEAWLQANTWKNPVLKWNTQRWGEIPADFGRK